MNNNKPILNEEIKRITEIMSQNSPKQLLLEGGEFKVLWKVIDDVVTEADAKAFLKRFGFSLEYPVEKFVKNFDTLIKKIDAAGAEGWDAMIANAKKVETDTVFRNMDGEIIDYEQATKLDMDEWTYEVVRFEKIGDELIEISEEAYEQIIKDNELFYSLPPFLRAPVTTIERRLASELGADAPDAIKKLSVFMKELHLFLRDGSITKGLRLAIIRALKDTPGFAYKFAKKLMSNATIAGQVRAEKMFGDIDAYWKQFSKELQLAEDGTYMRMIKNYAEDSLQGVLKYMEFLFRRTTDTWVIAKKIISGKGFRTWSQKAKVLISDVFLGGIWNWMMGAAFVKPILKRIRTIYSSGKVMKGLDINFGKALIQTVVGWLIIGGVKSMQYQDIKRGMDIFGWFHNMVNNIKGKCTGKNKVNDALTGQFFSNATGADPESEGDTCQGIMLQKSFIDIFKLPKKVVEQKAKKIYYALNGGSDESSKWFWDTSDWTYFDMPTIVKVILDFFNLHDPNREYFKQAFFHTTTMKVDVQSERDMDIFKMSQIADYYETEYSASLLEDAAKLDNWAKFFGREKPEMSFSDLKTAINKLPYLADSEVAAAYKTYKELVVENQKYILVYPRTIKTRMAGGLAKKIDIRKCCETGMCKCPQGCDIGATMIGPDMTIKLAKLYKPGDVGMVQADVDALTFKQLKKAFDSVYGESSTNKCWLNPNPEGDAHQDDTWSCETVSGVKGCVKKTDGSGTYDELILCQLDCED